MFTNRNAQLIFQSMFVALGVIGIIGSFGVYEYKYDDVWYTYFTNLSNYLCIGVMFAELLQTARKPVDSFVTVAPRLKFVSVEAILLTCLVFNLLLANQPDRSPAQNVTVTCILFHTVLPIAFTADWILFYRHKVARWTWPLLSTIFPILYLVYIFVRAAILNWNPDAPNIYPYFFLDVDTIGWGGVVRWIVILLVAFMVFGYLLMALDRALRQPKGAVERAAEAAQLA
ncbi:Pr6Pr family membrane protein [Bifidobacterium choloepi]|uniref:Pr6Pr family membrane protein n=1 Tax=Bifidobacterium choloepi TaxID=2614131 RepID=A0A6I5MYW9_9BIFI|nr:Pr6Pr family membrane protein [Bifidobacterium choloepi]NEG69406.1 hypothetical protein [Bifidobacterium choloepi]